VDATCVLVMHVEQLIQWMIPMFWATVSLGNCFFSLLVPFLGMESAESIQMAIALDRFLHVFFPFWLMICISNIFYHDIIFLRAQMIQMIQIFK
jgi:hypothetical protein